MAFYLIGKDNKADKAHYGGVLTEPSSYDAHTPPVDVQLGAVYYAQGERRVGTGKAFEFAEYGSKVVEKITDSNGIERYGITFWYDNTTNVIFVAPSKTGDIVLQDKFLVTMEGNEEIKIANNYTVEGELRAYFDNERLIIYLTAYSGKPTILRYFVGKDNHI